MKKLISMMLALVMSLSLVACGGGDAGTNAPAQPAGADITPAIEAFNSAATVFDNLANEINANAEAYPQDLIDTMVEMSGAMTETKALLESSPELTEEKVRELVGNLNSIEDWVTNAYDNLENMTIEATAITKDDVIEYFNYVTPRFDAISIAVNENIDQYEEEFVDGMIEVATGMIGYKEVLESGEELDEETCIAILEELQMIDEWITSVEEAEG